MQWTVIAYSFKKHFPHTSTQFSSAQLSQESLLRILHDGNFKHIFLLQFIHQRRVPRLLNTQGIIDVLADRQAHRGNETVCVFLLPTGTHWFRLHLLPQMMWCSRSTRLSYCHLQPSQSHLCWGQELYLMPHGILLQDSSNLSSGHNSFQLHIGA